MKRITTVLWLCVALNALAESPWAFRPLQPSPDIAKVTLWENNRIDSLVLASLNEHGMKPSPQADKTTRIRRVYHNLLGLPPTPEEVESFTRDNDPNAWEKVVDRVLSSPRYGERWARHWMDVVHFAETHGHDEDAIRPNAWPYRDYLIRSFNTDKPYAPFVREQIAGDVLRPDDPDAVIATGFLAAGPWDSSSQMGIQDGTVDKEIARYLDRDDMLSTAISTFVSLTAHCARCHDHKFDPISKEDYYALQSVFAGIDRIDRPYEIDAVTAKKRSRLLGLQMDLKEGRIPPDDSGFFEWLNQKRSVVKLDNILHPSRIESSQRATMTVLEDGSVLSGGERPDKDELSITVTLPKGRITALILDVLCDGSLPHNGPGRQDNGNLHLSEIDWIVNGESVSFGSARASFNQASWGIGRAIDGDPNTAWGIYPEVGKAHRAMFILTKPLNLSAPSKAIVRLRQLHGGGHLIGRARLAVTGRDTDNSLDLIAPELAPLLHNEEADSETIKPLKLHYFQQRIAEALAKLPPPASVFAVASEFKPVGNFKPAGIPRAVHVLNRGDVRQPGPPAQPGALSSLKGLSSRFVLNNAENEGERRAALAAWITNHDNVLTWRSIANRIWHYHFGRGIVSTPNDFGAMGGTPTHPGLLDLLAREFRASDGSLKHLHRTIVTSAVYQQSSDHIHENAEQDAENRFLWRMNRHRLDAESLKDSVLQISGCLNLAMGGPSVRQFHLSPGVHITPVLDYLGFNPDDPAHFRRSVYRFIFRTVPDPLMQALNCPDASLLTPSRETSSTALQALAMMNNSFLIQQSQHLARRLEHSSNDETDQLRLLFRLTIHREPEDTELQQFTRYKNQHGLANACRIILNSNEFMFID